MSIRISAHVDSGIVDINVTDGAPEYVLSSRLWFSRHMGPIPGYPARVPSANRVHVVRSVTPQANALRTQSSPTLSMSMGSLMAATLRDGTTVDVFLLIRDAARIKTCGFKRGESCGIAAEDSHHLDMTRDALRDAILADSFVRSYLETALWSSTMMPEDSEVSDLSYEMANFDPSDVSLETAIGAKRDCEAFQLANATDLELADDDTGRDAHNFWLSRNGHGAGFFDRCDDIGDRLQESARAFGEVNLYHFGDPDDAVIYSDADVDTMGPFDLETIWS